MYKTKISKQKTTSLPSAVKNLKKIAAIRQQNMRFIKNVRVSIRSGDGFATHVREKYSIKP